MGLISVGRGIKDQGKAGLSQAARDETQRNRLNDQIDAAEEGQKKATAGTAGGLALSYGMKSGATGAAAEAGAGTFANSALTGAVGSTAGLGAVSSAAPAAAGTFASSAATGAVGSTAGLGAVATPVATGVAGTGVAAGGGAAATGAMAAMGPVGWAGLALMAASLF